jgi:hypothetical protein
MLTKHSEPINFFCVRSAITIGAGCIGVPLLLAEYMYKEEDCVRCASPIFMPIAYYLGFTNRKRKYVKEKMMTTLKSKQTSIATVRSGTTFEHLTAYRPPSFFIGHYLKLKQTDKIALYKKSEI